MIRNTTCADIHLMGVGHDERQTLCYMLDGDGVSGELEGYGTWKTR